MCEQFSTSPTLQEEFLEVCDLVIAMTNAGKLSERLKGGKRTAPDTSPQYVVARVVSSVLSVMPIIAIKPFGPRHQGLRSTLFAQQGGGVSSHIPQALLDKFVDARRKKVELVNTLSIDVRTNYKAVRLSKWQKDPSIASASTIPTPPTMCECWQACHVC